MKIVVAIFCLFTFQLLKAQTNIPEALNISLNKSVLQQDLNVGFIDKSKEINLPNDGMFLYSSLHNNGDFNYGYDVNEDYIVTISNPSKQKIRVRTDYIVLADEGDVLSFYDGPDTLHPLLASYTKVLIANELIVSHTGKLTIRFKSNASMLSRGFRLRLDEANLKSYALSAANACLNSTPAADACVNAPLICNLNGYCGNTSGQYTPDNKNITGFCGSIENNSWLSFIASSSTAQFEFISAGCQSTNSGIQALIYASSNCSNFTQVSNCVSQSNSSGSFTITTNTPLVVGTKYYIMVDGFGGNVCSYSVTAQSGVATNPQVLANPAVICPGSSTQLGSSITSSTYSWTASDGAILPSTANISVSPTITTTYTLAVGPSGCSTTGGYAVETVTVSTILPSPNVSAPNGGCSGNAITLSSLTNGGTYNWTGPNGFSSTVQNPTINGFGIANAGTYSLSINYGVGCATLPATINVNVLPSPNLNLSVIPANAAVCAGSPVVLTASGASSGSGANPYSWNWNTAQATGTVQSCVANPIWISPLFETVTGPQFFCADNPFPGTNSGPTATVIPNQNTTACVSVTENGCTSQICQNITVLSLTTLNTSPSVTTCPQQPVTLAGAGASTYTWTGSDITSSVNNSTISVNPPATTIYTVTGLGCGGSLLTNTVEVTINNITPIIGAIQTQTAVCPNETDISFTVNNLAGTTYNWTLPTGAVITSTSSTTADIVANYGSAAGLFTVAVTATNSCGAVTETIAVQVTQINIATSPNPTSFCAPGTSTLTVSGANWYDWQPSNDFSVSSGTLTSYVASPTVTTTYTVTGTQGACINTAVVTLTVNSAVPIVLNASPPSICIGQSVNLSATPNGVTTYSWNNGITQSTQTVSPNTTTTYTVIGNTSCPSQAVITVTVNNLPTISVNPVTICAGKNATLTANGATSYTWSNGSNQNPTTITTVNTPTNYTVTGSNSFGCVSTQTTAISVNHPIASFSGMTNAIETIETILSLQNTSTGASSFEWETCYGSVLTSSVISVPLLDTGFCCVKLYAYEGSCIDSVTKCVQIVVKPRLLVPNVFTPNGDGKNDYFTLDANGIGEINAFIFDRWGLKMFETTTSGNIKWDGKNKNGSIVSDGTYLYIIKATGLDGEKYDLKGTVNVFQ